MWSCLVAYVKHFRDRMERLICDTFAKWRNLKSERLLGIFVRKECARKLNKASWKPLGSSIFLTVQ